MPIDFYPLLLAIDRAISWSCSYSMTSFFGHTHVRYVHETENTESLRLLVWSDEWLI